MPHGKLCILNNVHKCQHSKNADWLVILLLHAPALRFLVPECICAAQHLYHMLQNSTPRTAKAAWTPECMHALKPDIISSCASHPKTLLYSADDLEADFRNCTDEQALENCRHHKIRSLHSAAVKSQFAIQLQAVSFQPGHCRMATLWRTVGNGCSNTSQRRSSYAREAAAEGGQSSNTSNVGPAHSGRQSSLMMFQTQTARLSCHMT